MVGYCIGDFVLKQMCYRKSSCRSCNLHLKLQTLLFIRQSLDPPLEDPSNALETKLMTTRQRKGGVLRFLCLQLILGMTEHITGPSSKEQRTGASCARPVTVAFTVKNVTFACVSHPPRTASKSFIPLDYAAIFIKYLRLFL